VVPAEHQPVIAFRATVNRADGAWVVLRVTDPEDTGTDGRAPAATPYRDDGRAIAYCAPFFLAASRSFRRPDRLPPTFTARSSGAHDPDAHRVEAEPVQSPDRRSLMSALFSPSVTLRAALAALALLLFTAVGAPAAAVARPVQGTDLDVIAHRGSSGVAPENTLAAVEKAIAQRANWFEIDIQRSADGHLVLMHDGDLRRTTDVEQVFPDRQFAPIGTFTLAELERLDAGSWFGPEFAGEPVPTLAELLALIGQRIGFLLEVKNPALYPGIEQQIVDELRAADGYLPAALAGDRLVVQSFDHASMRRTDGIAPEIPVGLLTGVRMTTPELQLAATYAEQINPSFRVVDRGFVEEVDGLGMDMSVYTVNTGRDMRAMLDLGVDGIITDYPAVLLDLLARR
jgi:glycerophosphoryl diester phosphodiesterase